MAKFLIAGLGNTGAEYTHTRHNIGFIILDAIAQAEKLKFSFKRYGEIAAFAFNRSTCLLLKPATFVNRSGFALHYWLKKEKIPVDKMLVVVDDIGLPFGTIRIRKKGSDGGHNGLAHINSILETSDYSRLRFGIGNEFQKGGQVDYVLGEWTRDEKSKLPERIIVCIDAIKSFGLNGIDKTMTLFNGK
ncbi:MAG: aminoacyl-tRNA hydrolase [Bacteroidetes bacterium]|nr:aminoacyl-tRNA hydrolase [Bacteroidota bacterium]